MGTTAVLLCRRTTHTPDITTESTLVRAQTVIPRMNSHSEQEPEAEQWHTGAL